ncbi:hypothetical protein GQ43DRAFT_432877 [Delitschia confertaspora ATCC 74209]|uniref:Mitochondrial distribution and morphology protein 31 n=1 Tax=Delitschia confertaspora ATCC 74209 TaxID=1513339 RepID=A0A9P4JJ19_9PLEO|nr:hypothetical protein GQ43DRAFT_432877 [Delitschia confertaspora ATCC 74209]
MSRNVICTVGASLRRSVVDQLLPSRAQLGTTLGTSLERSAPYRSIASSSHITFRFSKPPIQTTLLGCLEAGSIYPLKAGFGSSQSHRRVTTAAVIAWRRTVHTGSVNPIKIEVGGSRRHKSSTTNRPPDTENPPSAPEATLSPTPKHPPKQPKTPSEPQSTESHASSKSLLDRLPHSLPHFSRPSKADLLAAASGFWSRLKVHFKWFTIRSNRPFNADEIYALISWILAAHIAWVILGTTTFFSLAIFAINTVFAQETLAKWIGNYLTKSSGIKVIFESAVVPKWKDGVISFKKVFVSRRPGQGQAKVIKGSTAAAAAAMAHKEHSSAEMVEEEDTNYTQFDVSIDTVNVTLSFSKWFNGKGLLKDVEVKGIRGVVDRTSVHSPEEYIDPRTYKHEHHPGDFELDSFKMEDLLVTIYQPNNFRPFSVSVFSCELPRLRKQWLFYDFLSASMMSGSFDDSLFTIHPRQTHNYTGTQLINGVDAEDGRSWKKQSRIRIDGLNIDHLNRGYEGPFSWIYEGNVDIVADIMIPSEDDDSIAKVMSNFYDSVEATVTSNGNRHYSDHAAHGFEEGNKSEESKQELTPDDNRFIIMDVRVHLNDVRAAVPIFTKDISYVNNALVRPIVAYINSKKTFIPVNCRVVKRASEFDGSWTIYDSGLMDDLSREMYDAFARDVLHDNTARKRRMKKVGMWTLQLAAQALFLGLAGNIA